MITKTETGIEIRKRNTIIVKKKKHHGKKEKHRHDIPSGKPFKELIMIVEALEERVTALEEENAELKSNLACISDESDGYNVYFGVYPGFATLKATIFTTS